MRPVKATTMSRRGEAAAAKEEDVRSPGETKEFTTKAEYNRWLVRQQNAAIAEETRQAAKAGEEFIKDRKQKHTSQGLSRQQAAMVQMKRASESLEAHRQNNLTHGRKVYEEVSGWREKTNAAKEEVIANCRKQKEEVKRDNKTGEAIKEMLDKKKSQSNATRSEKTKKAEELKTLKTAREQAVTRSAQTVKEATSDKAIDASKRMFYEQRLTSAAQVRAQSATSTKKATEEKAAFDKTQQTKRLKAKTARTQAGKSRELLLAEKTAAAVAMRQEKEALKEVHREKMQSAYLEKAAAVSVVKANAIYNEADYNGTGSQLGSPKLLNSPKGAAGGTRSQRTPATGGGGEES